MKKEYFLTFTEVLLLLFLVVVPLRVFLFEPFFIKGESMEPNFHNWDYLIIDKLTYRFRQPQRGEVIVFHPPFDDRVYYIKRIIGLPQERLILEGNKITILKEGQEPFVLKENYLGNHYTSDKLEITLGKDEYFVLGDNREASYDSRKWGPIKRERIIGKVLFQFSLFKLVQAFKR